MIVSLKRLFSIILTISLLFIGYLAISPASASAHVLLPQNVVNYIHDHPDATPQEIETYIRGNSPYLSKKVKNQQDIIRIVHQKTSLLNNSWDFLKLGVTHILSGPDHILFVLSFLLVFFGIKQVLKYTGTFTVAHSITLILAGSGLLTLSSRIVEPVIAFSIAAVAITSVFLRKDFFGSTRTKLAIIFFFGLFHGLGFAGLLKEIQIPPDKFLTSLLSFNIGIEIGQLFIVALALPFIYLLREKDWYPTAVKIAASIIASIALFWMFQRIFAF